MLSNQQQALVQAIQQLDLDQVQSLLAEGLDPNFIDPEHGFLSLFYVMAYLCGGRMSVKLMKQVSH
jgi:hypothetical protein